MSTVLAAALVAAPLLASMPAAAVTGGPDSYGYVWVDSRAPSPIIPYEWIDISSSGSRLNLSDDGCTFEVGMGFQFRYYGALSDQVFVCSNGFISFGVPDSFYADPPIPSPLAPNNRVVALGIDLNPSALGGGGVLIKSFAMSTPRRFVVTWDGVYKALSTQPETFQIILEQNEMTKDGRVFIQYKSLNGLSSTPLVGIENATGSSGLTYPGPLENGLAVAFLPPSDAAPPPDELEVAGTNLAPPTTPQGSRLVPMLRLDFSTQTNDVVIRAVSITLSGQGAGSDDVVLAHLWKDDGDGVFSAGPPDVMLSTSNFTGSPPVAKLSTNLDVTMGAPIRLFVSYDVSSSANTNHWIGARLPSGSSISVEYPDTVAPTGFPIETYVPSLRTHIVASQDTLVLADYTPRAPATVTQWTTDVPFLSMLLDANQNIVDVSGMRVWLGGNANVADVWLVKAVLDRDSDGNYTPGEDVVLAIAAPTGAPAYTQLTFALRIISGSPENVLILVDVGPFAAVGHLIGLNVGFSDISLPAGSVDSVGTLNFPAMAGTATIAAGTRPDIQSAWPAWLPRPDSIWHENEYLLDPYSTIPLTVPAGNLAPGYLTVENNATHLFIAVDATADLAAGPSDGIAFGFDTDANEMPTSNADDVLTLNATGGVHMRYNSGSGNWQSVGSCDPAPPTGDIIVPSCAAGFGATAFSSSPHRFYEFAIPLTALGVSVPVPPNTTLRFALASPPYVGLLDGSNRSTWPLISPIRLPLSHFGSVALAQGPAPNRPPLLDWIGQPGYLNDGLEPETGSENTTYTWRISYSDPDNDPPAVGQPLLYLTRNGADVPGSPFFLPAENSSDYEYRDGKRYGRSLANLQCGGLYSYYFAARDAHGLTNSTPTKNGPVIRCPDRPPLLLQGTVSPVQGMAGDSFTYRIVYQDPEGQPPASIDGVVFFGDTSQTSLQLDNIGWVAEADNYSAGAVYADSLNLTTPGTNYSYQFHASDGNHTSSTPILFGPYVLARPPDILRVAGVDLAPLVVDEGSRSVPFLQLYLITSGNDVNVTGIRARLTGTADDADVERVSLYHDVDDSGTLTAPDRILGAEAPVLGAVNYTFSLKVEYSTPASLLFLVDIARPGTADARIGIEVNDSTYVSVGPDDAVQSFTPHRSTRSLVNVAPQALDVRVDGYPDGSAGVGHIMSSRPSLRWQFGDSNSGDLNQIAFNASLHSPSPYALLWFANYTGTLTSLNYSGLPLSDGVSYIVSVSTSDGRLWSPPSVLQFRLNTAPPVPSCLSPANGSKGNDPNTTLIWELVNDAESDEVTYRYWLSIDSGFGTALGGVSSSASVTLALAKGTTYFWKVSASDGWESSANGTAWSFSTSGVAPPPAVGEVRGRVLNGTAALPGAFVELLAGENPVRANVTKQDGTFDFTSLELRAYTVRVSAYGFETQRLNAELSENKSLVDLGDILMIRTGSGGETPESIPAWVLVLTISLAVALVALTTLFAISLMRRREKEPTESKTSVKRAADEKAAAGPAEPEAKKAAKPKSVPATPRQQEKIAAKPPAPKNKG